VLEGKTTEGQRQEAEIGVAEFAAPLEQPYRDKKEPVRKKSAT